MILKKKVLFICLLKVLFKNHKNLRHAQKSIKLSLKVVFQSFGLIIRDDLILEENKDFKYDCRLFSESSIMDRIFECLGEFGLVEYQFALLDYFYEKIIKNIGLKVPYLNWVYTLRDDRTRKGYLLAVC